ncbi:MAG: 16S rRNA (cytosine(1402)-N(4))-methyltransferase RsmH [Parcubacteria group bacterium]
MHVPVLLEEVLHWLSPKPGQIILDGTFGAGGHASLIFKRLGPTGKLIGLDRDAAAIDQATHRFKKQINAGQLVLVQEQFPNLVAVLQDLGQSRVDGVLLDLGVSSEQLTSTTRGFSFSGSAPLDMRMDQREDLTAARILAEWSEAKLQTQFALAGEQHYAHRIAQKIVAQRRQTPLERTDQLVDLVRSVLPRREQHTRGTHVATKVFLALRLAVNHELEQIETGLRAAVKVLAPGGRLVVISFHSLEDRIVKDTFRTWAKVCTCPPELPLCRCGTNPSVKILTKKPITPSSRERATNPRARSAKLRACQIL